MLTSRTEHLAGRFGGERNLRSRMFFVLLAVLFMVYAGVAWVSTYTDTFGERDCYRVFVGVMDALLNHKEMTGSLVYGYPASKGYFFIVRFFSDLVNQPEALASDLNRISFWCVLIGAAATFVMGLSLSNWVGGLLSVSLLVLMPLWFYVGQYAHPMWPAIALFLVAAAFMSVREKYGPLFHIACEIMAVLTIGLALTMRLDVILMAPMFLGFCADHNGVSWSKLVRVAALGLVGVIVGLLLAWRLPASVEGGGSVLALLSEWHNPHRFVQFFGVAQIRLVRSINPMMILLFIGAIVVLVKRRHWQVLLFVAPVVVLNYLFWIPNPAPERHFLYLVPALALGSGIGLASLPIFSLSERLAERRVLVVVAAAVLGMIGTVALGSAKPLYIGMAPALYFGLIGLIGSGARKDSGIAPSPASAFMAGRFPRRTLIPMIAPVLALVILATPPLYLYWNMYSKSTPDYFTALGRSLLELPPLDRSLLVISDGYPVVAAEMTPPSMPIAAAMDIPWVHVDTPKNKFSFAMQGWIEDAVFAAVQQRAAKEPVYVYVDPKSAPNLTRRLQGSNNLTLIDLNFKP